MISIPTLETDRVILRPWRESDLDAYAELMADGERTRFVGGPLSRDDAWRKMAAYAGQWLLRGYGTWALEAKQSQKFIGYCGLWHPEGWPEREIGWGVLPACGGRGYVTEAAMRARTYAYEMRGWTTVVSVIALENIPSIRVAERLGATFERTTETRGIRCGVYRHLSPGQLKSSNQANGA
jgi:RimJ/RimL family protein N-acetyltransferase